MKLGLSLSGFGLEIVFGVDFYLLSKPSTIIIYYNDMTALTVNIHFKSVILIIHKFNLTIVV